MHPSREVKPEALIPGTEYWSFPEPGLSGVNEMRGTFVEHFTNQVGYPMVRFRPAYVKMNRESFREYSPFNQFGFISRIFLEPIPPMRRYYKVARFTPAEVEELRQRVKNRERREAQRALMGSFPGRKMGSWPVEKLPAVILGLIAQWL
jgi:hypothetical protein